MFSKCLDFNFEVIKKNLIRFYKHTKTNFIVG